MSETTRTHTPGKQLSCDILISSLMKHVLTNRPTLHSDSEKLNRKIWPTKSSSSIKRDIWRRKKKFDMVCDMIFLCPLLDFSIHVIGFTPLLLLHYLIEKAGDSTHRRTCRWGWGAATPPSPRPSECWATQIFGAAREIWANQIFNKVSMFRFAFFFSWKELFFFILSLSQRGKASKIHLRTVC